MFEKLNGSVLDRRSFLRGSALFAGAIGVSVLPAFAQQQQQPPPKPEEEEKKKEEPKDPFADSKKEDKKLIEAAVIKFKSLADKGFYDGTTFHRINPQTGVVQGGAAADRQQPPLRVGDDQRVAVGDHRYGLAAPPRLRTAEHPRHQVGQVVGIPGVENREEAENGEREQEVDAPPAVSPQQVGQEKDGDHP